MLYSLIKESTSDTHKVDFNKLLEIDPDLDYELETRSGNETYKKIYNKFMRSKSKIIRLAVDEMDYLIAIYEDSPDHDKIERIIYKEIQ